ncbi:polyphosphoinositide phosphatase Fig4 [Cryomyces antarcticus]
MDPPGQPARSPSEAKDGLDSHTTTLVSQTNNVNEASANELTVDRADGDDDGVSKTAHVSEDKPGGESLEPVHAERPEADHAPASVPQTPRSGSVLVEKTDEEQIKSSEPRCFDRFQSPENTQKNKQPIHDNVGGAGVAKMHKFSLYETASRFYLVGGNVMDSHFRVLKIDRTSAPGRLSISEDDIVYDKREMIELLNTVDDGNKATGGMKLKCSTWGLLGFIRFTEAYYMLLVTKRRQVAMIGGHYIYQIDGTELVPLTTGSSSRFQRDRAPDEARFLGILNNLDLSRSFYFSYSYNVTRTLQHNIVREREAANAGDKHPNLDFNAMFVWNHFLLEPAVRTLKSPYEWCLPIIHGFIDQAALDIFGRCVYMTIIARRSRFFAGARFLKRGVNDLGYVANDVETEQIVSEVLTTSFHAPGPRLFSNPTYTSYIQHRGSIPLYWTQDNTGVSPKPDIDLNLIDPFYQAAALHFDNLFERYGPPIYVLNLIKARERTPRESKLLYEFQNAIEYLNQSLPEDKKIVYDAFDMSRASKTRGGDVIGTLETIAERIVDQTGFFHNGDVHYGTPQVQNGVARTNCIDCLDRTNAAQFVIGKKALARQLQALGVINDDVLEYDTDAVNIFTHMFHDHGDTIAIQYGGSHLVNTMATYRKLNHWHSHSRDMVESFKRYYHNSFLDSQRQEAYNLFLGNYTWVQGQPMLWDLTTDYYLHHANPRAWSQKGQRDYIKWFTPQNLEARLLPPASDTPQRNLTKYGVGYFDNYWLEYYKPLALSSFLKIYSYRMKSTARYLPDKASCSSNYDISPFYPRKNTNEPDSPEKKPVRKGVTIVDPHSDKDAPRFPPVQTDFGLQAQASILRDPRFRTMLPPKTSSKTAFKPADKSLVTQWTLNQFCENSLNPSVTPIEADEYERYVSHPLNLPLVVSTELPSDTNLDFVEYVSGVSRGEGGFGISLVEPFGERTVTGSGRQWDVSEDDIADYAEFLLVNEDPLTVTEEDGGKKRYKAYRQWLRGKSLFKQSKVDPEYKT